MKQWRESLTVPSSPLGGQAERPIVVLTDHPWDDLDLEREIIEGGGLQLVVGPQLAGDAAAIESLVARADPVAIITCWAPVSSAAVSRPRNLRIVARLGVGVDNIAVDTVSKRGAWVTNVPDYCAGEVSDHAIALMLAHFRGVVRLDLATKQSGWFSNSRGLTRISDLTVGIIGYGRIGRETARKLAAFGCRVLANAPRFTEGDGIAESASLAQLSAQSDVIILHAPLFPETTHLVDREFLRNCGRRPLIINVSRGGLVDNAALVQALDAGELRGAALDVIEGEPEPPLDLLSRADVIVTPHVAYASDASLRELRRRACEEVVRVLHGETPLNPVRSPAEVLSAEGEPLDGGVASDIRIIHGLHGPEVVKRALAKLKVAADWFSDPARSAVEVAAIDSFAELVGKEAVPRILWTRPEDNCFAMELVDLRLRNWKQDLLGGTVDPATAERVGGILGRAHRGSVGRRDLAERFGDISYFRELRIEPFFERVAERNPTLAKQILEVAQGLTTRRFALVHGDFSPKNILANGSDVVILDFEVAHWGDPRFDVAFCLAHLLLKAGRRNADRASLLSLAKIFIDSYRVTGPEIDDVDLVRTAGCLILARFDGASPIDYANDVERDQLRQDAIGMITHPMPSASLYLDQLLEHT